MREEGLVSGDGPESDDTDDSDDIDDIGHDGDGSNVNIRDNMDNNRKQNENNFNDLSVIMEDSYQVNYMLDINEKKLQNKQNEECKRR